MKSELIAPTQNYLSVNNKSTNFYTELVDALYTCKSFQINVAFVTFNGIQILLDALEHTQQKGVHGRVITSTYLNFTDPKSMRKLASFSNIQLKIFVSSKEQGFHPKSYIFEYEDYYKVFVGSSNLTQAALKSNIEWNVKTISKKTAFIDAIYSEFQKIWALSKAPTESLLNDYEAFIASLKNSNTTSAIFNSGALVQPNSMQEEAVFKLQRLREAQQTKALVIAATGSGKTYMAAFDVKSVAPKTFLFVAHRESILRDARKSFAAILEVDVSTLGLLTATTKDLDADYIFATNLSIANHSSSFASDHFDYIVIDEAHHVTANSYQRLLTHFTPAFMLGMTATPERGDANSIYESFDHNIALEVRLRDALEDNLVVPFHYFGITDAKDINYKSVNLKNVNDIAALLKTHYRVEHIIAKMQFYDFEGAYLQCVGFCANVEHAKFMADSFNALGYCTLALSGSDSEEARQQAMEQLADNQHPLTIIFTVDIFNEGIDIPSINMVLMLRPTASPVIFLQQLGRGLRKHNDKTFVTVLDFIGNHNRSFMIAIALYGQTSFDKDSLKVAVKNNFISLPGCTHVSLDEIAKEQILQQLEQENFSSPKYLKEEYFAFKSICNSQVETSEHKLPMLNHYLMIDGAPNPITFMRKRTYANTYVEFLSKVEPNNALVQGLQGDASFVAVYRFICDHLPAKRLPELLVLKLLMQHKEVSIRQVAQLVSQKGFTYSAQSLVYAFNYLAGHYFDTTDIAKYKDIGRISIADKSPWAEYFDASALELKEIPFGKEFYSHPSFSGLLFVRSSSFTDAINTPNKQDFLNDALDYAIARHEQEFGNVVNDATFLKLYRQYNMRDIALACQYTKKHSAFHGAGVLAHNQDIFLFIELHKDEDAIAYKDKFVSPAQMQWDSQKSSRPDRGRGFNIIHHQQKGLSLHLFVRKFRKIDSLTQPYIYIGEANYLSHIYDNAKDPITFQLALKDHVIDEVYTEFVTTAD